MKSLFEV